MANRITTAVPVSIDSFIKKQAVADAIVNIVLTGGVNYWLTYRLPFVPGTLPIGNPAPNLGGTFLGIAVLMSVFLTLIVFAITVSQRKAGKIVPGLPASTRAGFAPWWLMAKHLALALILAITAGVILHSSAPDLRLSPLMFTLIATVVAAVGAFFMSKSTTRATLALG